MADASRSTQRNTNRRRMSATCAVGCLIACVKWSVGAWYSNGSSHSSRLYNYSFLRHSEATHTRRHPAMNYEYVCDTLSASASSYPLMIAIAGLNVCLVFVCYVALVSDGLGDHDDMPILIINSWKLTFCQLGKFNPKHNLQYQTNVQLAGEEIHVSYICCSTHNVHGKSNGNLVKWLCRTQGTKFYCRYNRCCVNTYVNRFSHTFCTIQWRNVSRLNSQFACARAQRR